jgi:hypothetical protein
MPALPPTPAALAAHEIRASAAELEARRQQELISALVEMGFPQHAAREAAPRHVRLEEIVEELLGNGFKPSLTSTGEPVQGGEVAALRRMSLGAKMASRQLDPPTPPPLSRKLLACLSASIRFSAMRRLEDASKASGAGGGGGDGSQVELLMLRKTLKVKMLLLTIPIEYCCYVISVKHFNSVWSITLSNSISYYIVRSYITIIECVRASGASTALLLPAQWRAGGD